jgi:hypothetical protein
MPAINLFIPPFAARAFAKRITNNEVKRSAARMYGFHGWDG